MLSGKCASPNGKPFLNARVTCPGGHSCLNSGGFLSHPRSGETVKRTRSPMIPTRFRLRPLTLCDDGDPIDLMVLSDEPSPV
jgi:hypothetical protein